MPLDWKSGGGGDKINGIIENYKVVSGNVSAETPKNFV